MTFAAPLWLLLIFVAIWWFYRRTTRASLGVPSLVLWPESLEGRGRWLFLIPLLQALGCALLIVALARPQAGSSESVETREGIAIELVVDVSSSMDMNMAGSQQRRTRMEAAKELLGQFILGDGETLEGRGRDLLGLITFARYADTRSPLTSGHEALAQIVRGLTIQDRPNEDGTAYGDALALASARLHRLSEMEPTSTRTDSGDLASKVVILLTDGENNSGAHLPEEAGGMARDWGIKVYAISLGDAAPAGVGADALSPPERVLDRISRETGGIFRKAHDFESLQAVYREIDALERTKMKIANVDRVRELFVYPLALAIGTLVAGMLLEATWLRTAP